MRLYHFGIGDSRRVPTVSLLIPRSEYYPCNSVLFCSSEGFFKPRALHSALLSSAISCFFLSISLDRGSDTGVWNAKCNRAQLRQFPAAIPDRAVHIQSTLLVTSWTSDKRTCLLLPVDCVRGRHNAGLFDVVGFPPFSSFLFLSPCFRTTAF